MTSVELLDSLKEFLQKEVADEILLKKENKIPFEFVHPYVEVMTLPHKNFMPVDFQVPFILVGYESGTDNGDSNKVSVRIICAVWGGEIIEGVNIPDSTGYKDLINLIEKIKIKLVENQVIKGDGSVDRPINYGIYDTELVYPYWYGYLRFDMEIPAMEYPMKEFDNLL